MRLLVSGEPPEDEVLAPEHVGANHMYLYVIKVLMLCRGLSNYK
jgi:hypothetical protein